MKHHIIILLFLFSCLRGISQVSEPHFISFNIGTNIPLKDYHTLDTIDAVRANVGLSYSFESAIYLTKVFGIGLSVGGFSNTLREEEISKRVQADLSKNGKVFIDTDQWGNTYAMVGPYLSFGGNKVIVDFKLLGGLMNSTKPLVSITTNDRGETTIKRNPSEDALAFGFNYGIHFRIKLLGALGLRVNAEGIMSEQKFKSKIEYIRGSNTEVQKQKIKTEFDALNIGVGLIFTL